jgi:hypothetical protein
VIFVYENCRPSLELHRVVSEQLCSAECASDLQWEDTFSVQPNQERNLKSFNLRVALPNAEQKVHFIAMCIDRSDICSFAGRANRARPLQFRLSTLTHRWSRMIAVSDRQASASNSFLTL